MAAFESAVTALELPFLALTIMRYEAQRASSNAARTRAGLAAVCCGLILVCGGCAAIMSSATGRLSEDLSTAIRKQSDAELVREGAPAYLIMIDGLIEGSPESVTLLLSGARLYGAYATLFVDDAARARRLTGQARDYAQRALCLELADVCERVQGPFEPFRKAVDEVGGDDIHVLYGFAAAWATWIQTRSENWKAIAEVPKVKAAMARVAGHDAAYDRGGAQLYLGVLKTLRPPAYGGDPEAAKRHFERAIQHSDGKNLMAKTLYAREYARLVFDRELHDKLLQEVIEADPEAGTFTLTNVLARRRARQLLDESDEYF